MGNETRWHTPSYPPIHLYTRSSYELVGLLQSKLSSYRGCGVVWSTYTYAAPLGPSDCFPRFQVGIEYGARWYLSKSTHMYPVSIVVAVTDAEGISL